jgi:hypothetical protein
VIRSRDPAILASEGTIQVDANGLPAVSGAYSRSTSVTSDSPNLLRITVTVDYPRAAAPLSIVTLIYKPTAT